MYTPIFLQNHSAIKKGKFFIVSLTVFLLVCCSSSLIAQGNLMITPRRVVFEGQSKIQELNLANTGKDTARYLISMIQIRMKEDGTFEQITVPDSGQHFASDYIRFFPRSVTLGPGEAQAVKIQVTKQSQLVAGEYRSHIYFRAIPNEKPLGEKETVKDSTSISVHLTPIFGISIPVIIRSGETNAQINLSNTGFEMVNDSIPVVSMVFNRSGNSSVYGNLKIDFISAKGKVTPVGEIRGVAVYTPTTSRLVRVPLNKVKGVDYKTGKLHITYTAPEDAKPVKLAETELVLL